MNMINLLKIHHMPPLPVGQLDWSVSASECELVFM